MPLNALAFSPWIGVAIVAFGAVSGVLGALMLTAARRRRRTWTRLTGRVVASRLDGDGHQRFQVEYIDPAGRPVRF